MGAGPIFLRVVVQSHRPTGTSPAVACADPVRQSAKLIRNLLWGALLWMMEGKEGGGVNPADVTMKVKWRRA